MHPSFRPLRLGLFMFLAWMPTFLFCDDTAAKVTPPQFQDLRLCRHPRHMTLSEDGRALYVVSVDLNKVIRYDVTTGAKVVSNDTGAFNGLLERGGDVYALHASTGEVLVLAGDTLKTKGRMTVNESGPRFLSAPRGKYFKRAIFVNCGDGGVTKELRFASQEKMTIRTGVKGIKTMDYKGASFISQRFDLSPTGVPTSFAFGGPMEEGRGDHDDTPFLRQFHDGPYWFGDYSIYAGSPPRRASPTYRGVIAPEIGRENFYLMTHAAIFQFPMTYPFQPSKIWSITPPSDLRDPSQLPINGRSGYFHHAATKVGAKIALFIFDAGKRKIWRCDVEEANPSEAIPRPASIDLGVLPAFEESGHLSYSHDGRQVLHLAGASLRFMDSRCGTVVKRLVLPAIYTKVFDRGTHLIAGGSNGLYALDRNTGKTKMSFITDTPVHDLAPHPSKPVCYVAIHSSDNFARDPVLSRRIAIADETTGAVTLTDRVLGSVITCDPKGRSLYTALKYRVANDWFVDNMGYKHRADRELRLVLRYALDGTTPRLAQVNTEVGANLKQLAASPDGNHMTVVTSGALRDGKTGKSVYAPAFFPAHDISNTRIGHAIGQYPLQVAYHPTRPMAAGTNGTRIFLLDMAGRKIQGALPDVKVKKVLRIIFTPDGTGLFIQCVTPENFRIGMTIPLNLSKAPKETLGALTKTPPLPTAEEEKERYKELKEMILIQLSGKQN